MIQESLARKFKPVGFDQPEGSRRQHTKPRPELQEAFYRWVDGLPEDEGVDHEWMDHDGEYKRAQDMIKTFGEISYREANSLLVDFKPKSELEKGAGLFVSACYNQSSDNFIFFDADTPEIEWMGYMLHAGKVLVNNGVVGDWFGPDSSGIVVNNGEMGDFFCYASLGISINNGLCLDDDADFTHSGVWISSKYLKREECIGLEDCIVPVLKKYFDEMSYVTEILKDDESAKRFLERYGTGGEKIGPEIKEILRRCGME